MNTPTSDGSRRSCPPRLPCYYLAGIFTSLIAYRLLFHPLRKFPGPIDLKISALSLVWRVRHYDANQRVQDLHKKYGNFVRIGPSAISVVHPSIMKIVHSADSRFSKGDFYDLLWPMKSLQMMRDRAEHGVRRRVWSAAFSDRALRGYEKRMAAYQDKLLSSWMRRPRRERLSI
jgi:cytochrome P450